MKVIKWGILGSARIAEQQFIPAIKQAHGTELLAIASRTLERAADFAKKNGVPRAYGGYEELLNDPDVDAVYIYVSISSAMEKTQGIAANGSNWRTQDA